MLGGLGKKTQKTHKTQTSLKNWNEEKNTKRHKKNIKNTFGHSLPYNEPNMIFNGKLLIY